MNKKSIGIILLLLMILDGINVKIFGDTLSIDTLLTDKVALASMPYKSRDCYVKEKDEAVQLHADLSLLKALLSDLLAVCDVKIGDDNSQNVSSSLKAGELFKDESRCICSLLSEKTKELIKKYVGDKKWFKVPSKEGYRSSSIDIETLDIVYLIQQIVMMINSRLIHIGDPAVTFEENVLQSSLEVNAVTTFSVLQWLKLIYNKVR